MKHLGLIFCLPLLLTCPGVAGAADAPAGTTENEPASTQLTLDDLRTFTDVFNQVRRNYVEEVDERTLLDAAINGMLADLDPHSAYLPSQDYEDLDNSAKGQYVGIGVDVEAEDGRIVVKQVIVPSPADSAGMDPGDIITSVNRRAVKGRPLQDSIDGLSGPPGSTVELSVLKPGNEEKSLVLKREFVKIPALSYELFEEQFGYFRIVYFHRDSATDLKKTLDSVAEDGTVLQGVILDLRDNPGGVLQPAIEMADGFLDEGGIVSTRGRNASMQNEYVAKPGQWLPGVPVIILVDRGSASASEVLAGALQDHGRAVIVGERTFGKGSVQTILPLSNNSGLKLTTARYYTPSGRSIQAKGIEPDVEVSQTKKDQFPTVREADLPHHLENGDEKRAKQSEDQDAALDTAADEEDANIREGELGADPQLDRAVEMLKHWQDPKTVAAAPRA